MAYTVLLADDSITIQKVVELILSEEDAEVVAVGDGQEALDSLERMRPDIVLADIEMPKVNGYDICEHIRRNPTTSDIPVILMAGAFEAFDEGRARGAGASDYIIKPFDSADLLDKIATARTGGAPTPAAGSLPGGAPPAETPAAAPTPSGAAAVAPSSTNDTVSSSDEFGDDEFWEAEEIEISDVPAAKKPEAPPVTPPPAPPAPDMDVELEDLEEPGEESLWDLPEDAVEVAPGTPVDPTAETILTGAGETGDVGSDAEEPAAPAAAEDESTDVVGRGPATSAVEETPLGDATAGTEASIDLESAAGRAEETESPAPEAPAGRAETETPVEHGIDTAGLGETAPPPAAEEDLIGPGLAHPESFPSAPPKTPAPSLPALDAESMLEKVREAAQDAMPSADDFAAAVRDVAAAAMPDLSDLSTRMEDESRDRLAAAIPDATVFENAVRGALKPDELNEGIREAASDIIRAEFGASLGKVVEEILWDVVPEAVERKLESFLVDTIGPSVRESVDETARRVVPDIAEKLIQQEIERLRSES